MYTRLVHDFSRRNLSYSTDSLRAISGIFAVFSNRLSWHFAAGLPSHLLDHALLWRPASTDHVRNPNFPSWSWAGWIGQSTWELQNLIAPMWGIDGNVSLVPLQTEAKISQGVVEQGQTASDIESNPRNSILHISSTGARASEFRILGSRLNSSEDSAASQSHKIFPFEEIWTADGVRCGILYNHYSGVKGDRFLALSRFEWTAEIFPRHGRVYGESFLSWYGHICDNEKLKFSETCLINVILVESEGTWAERVGIGLIHMDIWQAVSTRQETITLR